MILGKWGELGKFGNSSNFGGLLDSVSKQKFTIKPDTLMAAFAGRANIEELKFKLSHADNEISLDNDGFYDFDKNATVRVLVITDEAEISSDDGDIEWRGSSLYVRLGAFSTRKSQLSARLVVFLADDERGVVFAAPGLPANLIIKFN